MMAQELQCTEKGIIPFLSLFSDGFGATLVPPAFLLVP
jgi:hypothetical protein